MLEVEIVFFCVCAFFFFLKKKDSLTEADVDGYVNCVMDGWISNVTPLFFFYVSTKFFFLD